MLYRVVVQVVVLLGSKYCVLSEATEKTVEGAHTGFLRQIMGKQVRRITGGIWVTPKAY